MRYFCALLACLLLWGPLSGAEVLPGPYVAEVIRVIDGDTFSARVTIWLGLAVTTFVRIKGIDAPEVQGRCDAERLDAAVAKASLTLLLQHGPVFLYNVVPDKYAERVVADVAVKAGTQDVASWLLQHGRARVYDGQRTRQGWCE